ncbi:hypothetical protein C8R43DRAFT_206273 [Mycena crocata]|nr:hypothetical protein C8R43DRAFT_206273 [Mycena crocata]
MFFSPPMHSTFNRLGLGLGNILENTFHYAAINPLAGVAHLARNSATSGSDSFPRVDAHFVYTPSVQQAARHCQSGELSSTIHDVWSPSPAMDWNYDPLSDYEYTHYAPKSIDSQPYTDIDATDSALSDYEYMHYPKSSDSQPYTDIDTTDSHISQLMQSCILSAAPKPRPASTSVKYVKSLATPTTRTDSGRKHARRSLIDNSKPTRSMPRPSLLRKRTSRVAHSSHSSSASVLAHRPSTIPAHRKRIQRRAGLERRALVLKRVNHSPALKGANGFRKAAHKQPLRAVVPPLVLSPRARQLLLAARRVY